MNAPKSILLNSPIFTSPGGKIVSLREQNLVLNYLGKISGKIICDIGTGTGRIARRLVEKGAKVIGIDNQSKELKRTLKGFKELNLYGFAPILADARHLPLKDSIFDAIICVRVLKYIPDYWLAIAEMERLLKPNGILVLEISNLFSWETLLRFIRFIKTHELGLPHLFIKKEVEKVLNKNNLRTVDSAATYKIPFFFWANTKRQCFLNLLSSFHKALLSTPKDWLARGIILKCIKNKAKV